MRVSIPSTFVAVSIATSFSVAADSKPRSWSKAYQLAADRLVNFTLTEKVGILTGQGLFANRCSGNTFRAGDVPSFCFNDGPAGVRGTDKVSAFPSSINLAATWDRDLMHKQGAAIGQEARTKGVNVLLGPDVNLVRSPQAGRMWETFGPDPFLSSVAAVEWINGLQTFGLSACIKHLFGEEQERDRLTYDVRVDDRTLHEAYLAPFARAISDASVGCIMCGYNKVNGTYACQNGDLIGDQSYIRQVGFEGFILSDWGATHLPTEENVDAGMSVEMPGGDVLIGGNVYGDSLVQAVISGNVKESAVDRLVKRVLATYYRLRQDQDFPPTNFNTLTTGSIIVNQTDPGENGNQHINARTPSHTSLIRQVGAASQVLLKNEDAILPLTCAPGKRIAIIGSDARKGDVECVDNHCNEGTVALGWGAGSANLSHLVWPAKAFRDYAALACPDLELVRSLDDDLDAAQAAARQADVAVVFVNSDSGEQILGPSEDFTAVVIGNVQGVRHDRTNLTLWHYGEALIQAVAKVNRHTIVVVHAPGPIIVESWIDQIKGLIHAGMPGEQSGVALVNVMFGAVNPSGKLPFTVARKARDYPARIATNTRDNNGIVEYKEGLFLDYRHFDAFNIQPRFEFGFGLSYTSFSYSNLKVDVRNLKHPQSQYPHDVILSVSFTIKNTGKRRGKEVSQLYLAYSTPVSTLAKPDPPKLLKGFDITQIDSGCEERVTITVQRRDLSYWNVANQRFEFICEYDRHSQHPRSMSRSDDSCRVKIMVGSSSRQIHVQKVVRLDR